MRHLTESIKLNEGLDCLGRIEFKTDKDGKAYAILMKAHEFTSHDVLNCDNVAIIPATVKALDKSRYLYVKPRLRNTSKNIDEMFPAIWKKIAKLVDKQTIDLRDYPHGSTIGEPTKHPVDWAMYEIDVQGFTDLLVKNGDQFYVNTGSTAPFGMTAEDKKLFWEPFKKYLK